MALTLETSLSAEYKRLNIDWENWNKRVLEHLEWSPKGIEEGDL